MKPSPWTREAYIKQMPREKNLARQLLESSEELTDEKLLMSFTEHEIEDGARIIDEWKLRTYPCKVFIYKGKEYGWGQGAIGLLTPEQIERYCTRKVYEVAPGMRERFETFAEAAEAAHARIAHIPKGERLGPWLEAMSKELAKRGIEV